MATGVMERLLTASRSRVKSLLFWVLPLDESRPNAFEAPPAKKRSGAFVRSGEARRQLQGSQRVAQLERIEAIEKRLWSAADTLRANSKYASNECLRPVTSRIFLRHAFSRRAVWPPWMYELLVAQAATLYRQSFALERLVSGRPEAARDLFHTRLMAGEVVHD